MKTRVGRYSVPVRGQHPTLLQFTGGVRGKHEAGVYSFWTAVLKPPYSNNQRTVIGRARVLLPPGEHFDRMNRERLTARRKAARQGYEWLWTAAMRRGQAIRYIRPSTKQEVELWLNTHGPDAEHWLSPALVGVPRPSDKPIWERVVHSLDQCRWLACEFHQRQRPFVPPPVVETVDPVAGGDMEPLVRHYTAETEKPVSKSWWRRAAIWLMPVGLSWP